MAKRRTEIISFRRFLTKVSVLVTLTMTAVSVDQHVVIAQPWVRMTLDGKAVEYKNSAFPSSLRSVRFYARSDADFTQPLTISVKAPDGAIVSVQAARTTARTASSAKRSSFYPIPMKKRGASGLSQTIRLKGTKGTRAMVAEDKQSQAVRASGGGCCGLSTESLDFLLQMQLYPACRDSQCICKTIAAAGFCVANPGSSPGGDDSTALPDFPSSTEDVDASYYVTELMDGAFMKDACAPGDTPSLLIVTIDLSRVKRSRLKNGLTLNVAAVERAYTGSRAASIKPVSDGKYAPRPLLIMARAAPGREAVRVVRWKQGKPRIERIYDRLDSAFYRGLSLLRVPVELPGGWASVDVLDDEYFSRGYGACLEMVRRRQRVNGYPTSPRGD